MPVFLISGVPGAGKTTVSRALGRRFERAVHLEGDLISEAVVSGRVLPHAEPEDEAARQLLVRRRGICRIADTYADAGFVPVIDDVVVSPGVLATYEAELSTRPLVFVSSRPASTSWRPVMRAVTRAGSTCGRISTRRCARGTRSPSCGSTRPN